MSKDPHGQDIEVIWKVRHISAGQPRPYADSVYEYEIELDGNWYTGRPDFGESVVLRAAQGLTRGWAKKRDDPNRGWHESYLSVFEKTAPHTWRVKIIEPYLD